MSHPISEFDQLNELIKEIKNTRNSGQESGNFYHFNHALPKNIDFDAIQNRIQHDPNNHLLTIWQQINAIEITNLGELEQDNITEFLIWEKDNLFDLYFLWTEQQTKISRILAYLYCVCQDSRFKAIAFDAYREDPLVQNYVDQRNEYVSLFSVLNKNCPEYQEKFGIKKITQNQEKKKLIDSIPETQKDDTFGNEDWFSIAFRNP